MMNTSNLTQTNQLIVVMMAVMLSACGGSESNTSAAINNDNAQSVVETEAWFDSSHNQYLRLEQQQFTHFQMVGETCWPVNRADRNQLTEYFGSVIGSDSQLYFSHPYSLESRTFEWQQQLPIACDDFNSSLSDDVLFNFEYFWQAINDYYAGFGVRDVDWQEVKLQAEADLISGMTLWQVMSASIDTLADPHLFIRSKEGEIKRSVQYSILHHRIANELDMDVTHNQFAQQVETRLDEAGQILIREYLRQPELLNSESVIFAQLNDSTAYLNLLSMNIAGSDNQSNHLMAQQVSQMLQSKLMLFETLVIDLRFNAGGSVVTAKLLAEALATQDGDAYQMQYQTASGLSQSVTYQTEAAGAGFSGEILLLTSPLTASAAEAFIYFLQAGHTKVTLIGENTRGVQSGPSLWQMPNDMALYIPNRRITSMAGDYLENTGFTVDVTLPSFSHQDIITGRDSVLDALINLR